MDKFKEIIDFIKSLYPNQSPVPLHAPVFMGTEKKYLNECIDSTFVSYVGRFVKQFEDMTAEFTGAKYAVAMVNGTTALQLALQCAGVMPGEEVVTQALTFVATPNAISHCGANPIFIDVDKDTLGMSPESLDEFLKVNTIWDKSLKKTINKKTKKVISAIVPMHTFGHPCRIDDICEIANKYNIVVIEDSAESLGSFFRDKHTGTFGKAGIISYNGNKTITTGGGGMIITDDIEIAEKAKHISTTAKIPHPYEFNHNMIGYNYRMTNVNAAIGVAQMENIQNILKNKKETYKRYFDFFNESGIPIINEPKECISNFWLNAILLNNKSERDKFLEVTNNNKVITRPIWTLMNKLPAYKHCESGKLDNSQWFEDRVVNIPSSVRL